jgi:hypothetical protein
VKVYTYSQARQQLASVLSEARRKGEARIRRRDGQLFVVKPERESTSPLEVPGITVRATTRDIIAAVRESRGSTIRFLEEAPSNPYKALQRTASSRPDRNGGNRRVPKRTRRRK